MYSMLMESGREMNQTKADIAKPKLKKLKTNPIFLSNLNDQKNNILLYIKKEVEKPN